MSDADPRIERALAGLRREWSPPPDSEAAMLADFHARLAQMPEAPEPDASVPAPSDVLAQVGHAAKVVAATLVTTALGLAVVAGVGRALRPEPAPQPAAIVEPRPAARAEPPREVTAVSPLVEPEPAAPLVDAGATSERPATRTRTREHVGERVDLEAELALLRAAEAAGGEDSLTLLEQHAKEFPSGALASEREGLSLVRLCELGRTSEAKPRAERFAREHASSLMNERIEQACSK